MKKVSWVLDAGIRDFFGTITHEWMVKFLTIRFTKDFLGFSYGFRPRRSQHDALDGLWIGITNDAAVSIVPPKIPYGEFSSVRIQCRNLGEAFPTDHNPRFIGLPSPIVPSPLER
jgi:retron-type reverse transcriptase